MYSWHGYGEGEWEISRAWRTHIVVWGSNDQNIYLIFINGFSENWRPAHATQNTWTIGHGWYSMHMRTSNTTQSPHIYISFNEKFPIYLTFSTCCKTINYMPYHWLALLSFVIFVYLPPFARLIWFNFIFLLGSHLQLAKPFNPTISPQITRSIFIWK